MNWNNSKIETSLANAVTEIVPDLEDAIWDAHVSRAGSETVLPAAATTSPARKTGNRRAILAVALVTAFIVSLLVVRALIGYLRTHSFEAFGWYRIVLGIVVILYYTLLK